MISTWRVAAALVAACALVACSYTEEVDTADGEGAAASYELPFGMVEPPGLVSIGRPATWRSSYETDEGVEIRGQEFTAAYRVTADDPVGVLRAWAAQLGGLSLDRLRLRGDRDGGPWVELSGSSEYDDETSRSDYVNMQLWTTAGDPILLVDISREREDTRSVELEDEADDPPPPAEEAEDRERFAGDVLFTEQNDDVLLPTGTRTLSATLPIFAGTGGSATVIAADDALAAIREMLAQAAVSGETDEDPIVHEPEVSEFDGTEVVTAGFAIPAGGWSFGVVAVRAPGDPYATLYVMSAAD